MKRIALELRRHAPFTALGTLSGILLMTYLVRTQVPREISAAWFRTLHPLHVFLSALVTAAVYRRHGGSGLGRTLLIGYIGSIGIATLSDNLIPYAGELILRLPHPGLHVGAIEQWWLVNPLALLGSILAYVRPQTGFPHAGHVLLSTWASLFHMLMALETELTTGVLLGSTVFLFLSVWIPCCTSDIVFPLLAAAALTNPAARKRWVAQEGIELLRAIGLRSGDRLLDFGCGWGAYSLPAAQVVGLSGRVTAVDRNPKAIRRLLRHAAGMGLKNLHTFTRIDDVPPPGDAERFRAILLYDVLHFHAPDERARLYRRCRALLAEDGFLSLHLKHVKENHPSRHFAECTLDEILREVNAAGFRLRDRIETLVWHGRKPEEGALFQFVPDRGTAHGQVGPFGLHSRPMSSPDRDSGASAGSHSEATPVPPSP